MKIFLLNKLYSQSHPSISAHCVMTSEVVHYTVKGQVLMSPIQIILSSWQRERRLLFCLQIIIDRMTKKIFDHNVVFEAVVSVLFTIIIGGMCGVGGGWGEVTVLGHWSSEEGAGGGLLPSRSWFRQILELNNKLIHQY